MTEKDRILSVEPVEPTATFTLWEVCEREGCHAEFVIKLVNYGVIAPVEESPHVRQWRFDLQTLARLHRAQRLQRDLKMNVPGLALSLELLDEVQEMRRKVDRLSLQLRNFVAEE